MTSPEEMEAALEAVLFVASEPLSRDRLLGLFGDNERQQAEAALERVLERYRGAEEGRGVLLDEVGGGFRLVTRPELHSYLRRFFEVSGKNKLSMAALETLAIVAYRQPITGPEIQELRGVSSSGVLKTLLERRLVRISGRKPVVGKPFLYATTKEFLLHFGLHTLKDLPPLEEFEETLASDGGFAGVAAQLAEDREESILRQAALSEEVDDDDEELEEDDEAEEAAEEAPEEGAPPASLPSGVRHLQAVARPAERKVDDLPPDEPSTEPEEETAGEPRPGPWRDARLEEPGPEEPAIEEPTDEEPGTEEPAIEEPTVEEPRIEEPETEEPTVEEPGIEEPDTEEPGTEEPVVDGGRAAGGAGGTRVGDEDAASPEEHEQGAPDGEAERRGGSTAAPGTERGAAEPGNQPVRPEPVAAVSSPGVVEAVEPEEVEDPPLADRRPLLREVETEIEAAAQEEPQPEEGESRFDGSEDSATGPVVEEAAPEAPGRATDGLSDPSEEGGERPLQRDATVAAEGRGPSQPTTRHDALATPASRAEREGVVDRNGGTEVRSPAEDPIEAEERGSVQPRETAVEASDRAAGGGRPGTSVVRSPRQGQALVDSPIRGSDEPADGLNRVPAEQEEVSGIGRESGSAERRRDS